MPPHFFFRAILFALAVPFTLRAPAQTPETPPPAGRVVASEPRSDQPAPPSDLLPSTPVTDAERSAIQVSSLNLDLHLIPAEAREEVHATLTLRNVSSAPLSRIPLQISSTLRWRTISLVNAGGIERVAFTQSPIATDADHTGYAQEAILTPAIPLAPGASLTVSAFYAGEIRQSSQRLESLGAPHDQASSSDWDAITPTSDSASTALRGFGNVLWYPVAAPVALLGESNRLFDLIARERRQNVTVPMRLRVTVEYIGDPPDAVIANGRMMPLTKVPDTETLTIDETHGIASAEFPAAPIGATVPSLFLTAQPAVTSADQTLALISPRGADGLDRLSKAAAEVKPLLVAWLGPTPIAPALLLDHAGQTFDDGALFAAPIGSITADTLVRPLTHAWLRAVAPPSLWIDQGLPEFMGLLLTEKQQGREAALAQLRHASTLIALAEPDPQAPVGAIKAQPLTEAWSDGMLHLKSAFVLWQLREILGEDAFRTTFLAYRKSIGLNPSLAADPAAFEHSIERTSGKDLAWFFKDWVYRDAGLPDLTIVQATPRPLPARPGKSAGFLIAVEVRNDGDAVADVAATVRSGTLSSSERIRIAPHTSASTRILFEGNPDTLQVNDGSVPEVRTTTHTLAFPIAN